MLVFSIALHVFLWHGLHALHITPTTPSKSRTLRLHFLSKKPPSPRSRPAQQTPPLLAKKPAPQKNARPPRRKTRKKPKNTPRRLSHATKRTNTALIEPKEEVHSLSHHAQPKKQRTEEHPQHLTQPFPSREISIRPSFETLQQLSPSLHKQANTRQPWAGTDRFSRRMQAHHQRWKEQNDARVGLTDHFLSKASTHIDRCLEAWFYDYFKKTVESLASLAPLHTWEGRFVITWDANQTIRTQLVHSKGLRMIDRTLLNKAIQCGKQIQLPKRLHGKYVALTLQTTGKAVRNYALHKIVGIAEERNPHTQQMEYSLTHLGKLHISANTLFLRGSIRENGFPLDLTR
jgi:hypothetical protein